MKTTVRETEVVYQLKERIKISNSNESDAAIRPMFADLIEECETFHVIVLSKANSIIAQKLLSIGGVSGCIADPKAIFHYALSIRGCAAIMVAHNHPSGNMQASQADIDLTRRLKEAGRFLECPLIDHIILSPERGVHFSFANEGNVMKHTVQPQLYENWEREVTDVLIDVLEITNSDAQGIVEAHSFEMIQSWSLDRSATETANLIATL